MATSNAGATTECSVSISKYSGGSRTISPNLTLRALLVCSETTERRMNQLCHQQGGIKVLGNVGHFGNLASHPDGACADLVFVEALAAEKRSQIEACQQQGVRHAPQAAIVVVGSLEDYTPEVFEMDAADYLLSSCSSSRFGQAIEKVRRLLQLRDANGTPMKWPPRAGAGGPSHTAPLRSLFVEDGDRFVHLESALIRLIEAAGNYVAIHAGRSIFCHRSSISSLEASLDPACFVRIHKSTIVNLQHVESVRKNGKGGFVFLLNDGTACISGISYRARIWRLLKPQSSKDAASMGAIAASDGRRISWRDPRRQSAEA